MFDPKMVEVVEWALAVHFSGDRMPHMSGDPRNRLGPGRRRAMEDARDSVLEALCTHLRITPEALNALAKGEAVVVPRTPSKAMLRAMDDAMPSDIDLPEDPDHPAYVVFPYHRAEWSAALAASPYAPKGGGDA